MPLTKEEKEQVRSEFGANENDSGSTRVQIAALTRRIDHLVEHLRAHKHDYASERGLLKLVGQRRRLLAYLRKTSPDSYTALIQTLGLRR